MRPHCGTSTGPRGWVDRELYRPLAHKGTMGHPPKGPGGPPGFSGLGKIPVKPFPGKVWGEIGPPKGFLGTIQTILPAKRPGIPHGRPIPPQRNVFQAPFLGARRGPGPSWAKMWGRGSKKWDPGSKISKLRIDKPCRIHQSMPQMEPYVASYGQIRFRGGAPIF